MAHVIEPGMAGSDGLVGDILEHGEMQEFCVEMQDVEAVGHTADAVEHQDVICHALCQAVIGQKRPVPADHKLRVHPAFAVGEDRDPVAAGAQRLRKACDHPLGPAVGTGRHRFHQGGYQCDAQLRSSCHPRRHVLPISVGRSNGRVINGG